jgi:hypothetical protein
VTPQEMMAFMSTIKQQLDSVTKVNDSIMKKLNKLDDIDTTLGKINDKIVKVDDRVCRLEKDMRGTNVTLAEEENSVKFASDYVDSAREASKKLESEVRELRSEIKYMHADRKNMHDDILDIQVRSMKDNLLFFGVDEREGENYMDTVLTFCKNELGISDAAERIKLDRAHRIGPKRTNKTRPLVAKFCYFQQRKEVRKLGHRLKGKHYGMSEQLPREVQDRKKNLMPAFYEAKRQNKKVHFIRDRLYVNDTEFVLSEQLARK